MSLSTLLTLLHTSHWLASVLLFAIVAACSRHFKHATVKAVSAFCFLSGYWAFFSCLIFYETDLEQLIFLNRLKLIAPVLLPLCMLSIAFCIQGKRSWHRGAFLIFSAIPLASLLLISSHRYHEMLIENYRLVNLGGKNLLAFSNGSWFAAHILNAQLTALVSIYIIFRSRRDLSSAHQYRIWLIILAIIVPFLGDGLAVHFFEELRFMQITPSLLLVSAIVMIYALIRKHFVDVIPFARGHILDSTGEIYLIFDTDYRLLDLNRMAKSCFHLNNSDCGKNLYELLRRNPELQKIQLLEFNQNQERSFANEIYDVVKIEILDPYSERMGIAIVCKNITLRKKVEVELEKANQFKTELLAIFGHDFQGNLAASLIISQNLSHYPESESSPNIRIASEKLQYIAKQNIALIEEILDLAKNQLKFGLDPGRIDLKEQAVKVQTFLSPLLESKEIRMEIDVPHDIDLLVVGDVSSFMTILRNLISNAIKFSAPKSLIVLKLSRDQNQVEIMVEDFGVGISRERQLTLFDRKVERGAGIGLLLCLEAISRLAGTIRVESTLGKGTRFFVNFPWHQ